MAKFKIGGDEVKVIRKAKSYENGCSNTWHSLMDSVIDKKVKIEDVNIDIDCNKYDIYINDRLYSFPEFVLEKENDGVTEVKGYMYKDKFYLTKEDIEKDKLIDDFCDFTFESVDELKSDKWNNLVRRQLTLWGWNNKAIEDFVNWGDDGFNNENLHVKNSLEDFYDEVEYCSDRMSLDRLFRCHVIYKNIVNRSK